MSSMQSVQSYASRTGWIMLAAIVMFSVGVLRIISGISYLANSHKINDYTAGFFGDNMWAWGLWDLAIAALAIWAAFSLLGGGEFGRVIAYLWAILVIINSFLTIGIAPWFGAAMLTLALLVIYGLASTPVTPLRAPQTSRRSSPFVKTRSGSLASFPASSNSRPERRTAVSPTRTWRERWSTTIGPASTTSACPSAARRRSARTRARNSR